MGVQRTDRGREATRLALVATMGIGAVITAGFWVSSYGCSGAPGVDLDPDALRLTGDPPVAFVSGLARHGLTESGEIGVRELTIAAAHVYEPGRRVSGMGPRTIGAGEGGPFCDADRETNWGEPRGDGPCAKYLPVIHARGDLYLQHGRGQGVLVVDGDLVVEGGVRFHGLVVVLGSLVTRGEGNRFVGRVLARGGGDPGPGLVGGESHEIRESGCEVRRALDAALRARPREAPAALDVSAAGGRRGTGHEPAREGPETGPPAAHPVIDTSSRRG